MILAAVFPVFFIVALGWLFAKVKHINLGAVSEILLYIATPCLIFSSLIKNEVVVTDFFTIALSVLSVASGCGLATWIFLRLSHLDCRGLYLPVMFMNAGNMALPLALLAFGSQGLSRAVVYYVISAFLTYSLGVMLVSPQGHLSEVFRLPLLYAAILGILFGLLRLPLSPILIKPFEILGGAAIPLMLLSLGYRLHSTNMNSPQVALVGAFLRIGLGFGLAFLFVSLFRLQGPTRSVILLSSSMPSAVVNFILAQRYERNAELVASVILISSLLSMVTTPLILSFSMGR
ncbi:MAG: AEC family transporter [candidate division NC10 bacterium]|nr:AEC family transporter [candidate division NC10 bacterium]